jgi:hypothetical protein
MTIGAMRLATAGSPPRRVRSRDHRPFGMPPVLAACPCGRPPTRRPASVEMLPGGDVRRLQGALADTAECRSVVDDPS